VEYQILSVFRCTPSQEETRVGKLTGQESCQNVSDLSADQREDLDARFDDPGCEQTDAERQLHPPAELIEGDREFQIRVALPGYDPKDVRVVALPDSILLEAKAPTRTDREDGEVRFSEFNERVVCRRFDLPGGIHVEEVAATLDRGILEITARKKHSEGKKIEVVS